MGIAEEIADKLAADVIAHLQRTGDEDAITMISKTLGDSSQTLQEAFITSVRVQRAAIRAERLLAERAAEMTGQAMPAPTPVPEPRVAATPVPETAPAEGGSEPAAPPVAEAAVDDVPEMPAAPEPADPPETERSRAAMRAKRLLEEREAARRAELEGARRRGRRAVPQVRDDPSLG